MRNRRPDDVPIRSTARRRAERAEHFRRHGGQVEPTQIAAHDQCGPFRVQKRPVDLRQLLAAKPRDRFLIAGRGSGIGGVGGVDRRGEGLLDATARFGASLQQVVQALVAQPGHVFLGERGMEHELGQ